MTENHAANCEISVAEEKELVTTRVISSSPSLVYEAWTKPEHLAQWWGPNGFTNTFLKFDLRPGGIWEFVMHGLDGVDYPNKTNLSKSGQNGSCCGTYMTPIFNSRQPSRILAAQPD
ncbi:SRPBCC domain-containing protein [Paenibacillus sp. UNC217MF]|uniref:SRPBCC domain-containing protein n=1 Tax=Paenibacillus sp. UNC217MF TaxID=1449062 RepID=UPI002F34F1FC